jgi:hypothetical protein
MESQHLVVSSGRARTSGRLILRLQCLPFALQVDLLLQVGIPFVLQVDSCFRIVSPSLFTYLLVGADLDERTDLGDEPDSPRR